METAQSVPRILWLGASYHRICRDWRPYSPVEILPEVKMSLEGYNLDRNIHILDDQSVYPYDPNAEEAWLPALEPTAEGLQAFEHLTESGQITTTVIEGCLVSGIMKAPVVSEAIRGSSLVILLSKSAEEEAPYRKLGYQHFVMRSDTVKIQDSLRALDRRIN